MPFPVPMRLLRIAEPFDHPDFIFEPKLDGFRALAIVEHGRCQLVSRNGHIFKSWPRLTDDIAASVVGAKRAILDGEICCVSADGRCDFYSLLFRRRPPHFYAFDVLSIGSRDLCSHPLIERKCRLADILSLEDSRLLRLEHVEQRGVDLFRAACARDLEGIVGKWAHGAYQTNGRTTSWVKVKNPAYSQTEGRHEFFEQRRPPTRAADCDSHPSVRVMAAGCGTTILDSTPSGVRHP